MKAEDQSQELIRLLREQSCWANVCTEPGMVAFMASKAAALLREQPTSIEIHLSGGVLKNALSAGLPHTTEKGPAVAAAAGAVARQPEKGLTILGDLTPSQVDEALGLVRTGRVTVKWDTCRLGVYGKCIVRSAGHVAEVVVSGSHTRVAEQRLDGRPVFASDDHPVTAGLSSLRSWTFDRLIDTVLSLETSELTWLLEGAKSCIGLSETNTLDPARLSATPEDACAALSCSGTPMTDAAGRTFKAIQARMSGTPWPVLTSGGSGNQGIMVSIPVWSISSEMGLCDEQKIRALALAHGVNMLVKAYTGEISSSCGGVSAGAGLAAAICWMLGGSKPQISEAVTEVLASLCGMVCDGAKATCALKGSSAVMTGIMAGAGASRSKQELRDQGVVGRSIDETLARLETLNRRVLDQSDAVLLELAGIEKV
ncbi:MAG: L-serine ammonia-lyase, iron-sulfur-dependent, subunit alpha [Bacillota bacterium]